MKTYPVKRAANGQALLNLACGCRTDDQWSNLDFSPYALLAHWPRLSAMLARAGLISPERYARLRGIDPNIIRHDLRRGIPFPDAAFDAVYSSHFLEHLPRPAAMPMLAEVRRVLVPGGVVRIVVPDLELVVARYAQATRELDSAAHVAQPPSAVQAAHVAQPPSAVQAAHVAQPPSAVQAPHVAQPPSAVQAPNMLPQAEAWRRHEQAVTQLFDPFIPHEGAGTAAQRPWLRRLERLIRGPSDRTGQLHRWMYDRHSLGRLLAEAGFADVRVEGPLTGRIADWTSYHLDADADGTLYNPNPGSLYIEAVRPG